MEAILGLQNTEYCPGSPDFKRNPINLSDPVRVNSLLVVAPPGISLENPASNHEFVDGPFNAVMMTNAVRFIIKKVAECFF